MKLEEWLEAVIPKACQLCQKEGHYIADNTSLFGRAFARTYMRVCKNCGHVLLFHADKVETGIPEGYQEVTKPLLL